MAVQSPLDSLCSRVGWGELRGRRGPLIRYRALLVALGLGFALISVGSIADAQVVGSDMTSTTVKDAGIKIGYPTRWAVLRPPKAAGDFVRQARSWLKRFPATAKVLGTDSSASDDELRVIFNKSMKNTRLFAVDTQGSGDNLSVEVESGEPVAKLAEWKALQKLSAQTTNSQVLSDAEVFVGGKHAFTHLETFEDPAFGPILFGYMEIAHGRHAVVSITFSLDANERSLAGSILASVHAAGH